ncbi:hypothetical protein [Streptomyces tropicalis]|uniref:DUF3592 domain-containing protein n=1 Tax=Streptomyces tropicalis TaxID=3034234 RepID=A0ABT5ZZ70_9ACTN|nr:hypothetical protein [Streptomyces tropicalis]MDF3297688.1 hypothetical protein [Streptomyces tropicalis]
MDVVFYALPSVIAAAALYAAYRAVRRWARLRRVWADGLTAEGRCLRVYTTARGGGHHSSVSTVLRHVYEFTSRDGVRVRFEEEGGPGTVLEGDTVTVHYAEGREDVVATAQRPRLVHSALLTLFTLAVLGTVVAFCVAFMATYSVVFTGGDSPGF